MKEEIIVGLLKEAAEQILDKDFVIKIGSNLYYELYFTQNLETSKKNGLNPKRGHSAFQTDLCIFEVKDNLEFPRVVIECKTNLSTHDILTYSAKAGKHKTVYPSLRYGLYVSEINKIPGKFFIHNEHIDFFIAGADFKNEKIIELAKTIIKKEISISKTLDSIYFENLKCNYFRTDIIFNDLNKE